MCFNAVSTHKTGPLGLEPFREIMDQSGDAPVMPAVAPAQNESISPFSPMRPLPTLKQAEDMLIEEALRRTDGNQTMASQLLGITRQTLNRHLRKTREA